MKIGFFTDGYLPQINGVATSTDELAKSLRSTQNEVTVIAPDDPKFTENDTNVIRLKSIKIFKNPEIRLAYMFPDKNLRQVLTKKFDIIHGFSGGAIPSLGLFLAKIRKIPYVFTYNTRYNQYTHYIFNGKLIKPKALEVTMSVYCNQCDVIVAPSDFIKDELLSFGVKKPIRVIPNGIDVDKFNTQKAQKLRVKLGLKEDDKLILYTGRLAKEKDINFIIKAFKKTSQEISNSYLLIVGDGPEKSNLRKLTKRLELTNRVIFLGYVAYEHIPEIYSEADLFAFASTTETQGMVILEAMASGICVLTVKHKVYESIIVNNKEGLIVEKDQETFAKQMTDILKNDDLRLNLGIKARKKAQQFSLSEIAKKFDTLYKEVI